MKNREDGPRPRNMSVEMARLFCCFAVQCKPSKGSPFQAIVSSIGNDGLRLEIEGRVRRGDKIEISLAGTELHAPIHCIVQWCRKLPSQKRLQAGVLVAAPWRDLQQTWLAPILRTLEYVEALPTPAWNGVEPPAPRLHAEIDLPYGSEVARLLREAQDKVRQRSEQIAKTLRDKPDDGLSVVERRLIGRLTCRYDVVYDDGQGPQAARAVDLSPAGLALETETELQPGTILRVMPPVGLEFEGSGAVLARVSYCKKHKKQIRCGLVLEDADILATWLAVALRFLGFSRLHLEQKRRYVRARAIRSLPVNIAGHNGLVLDLGHGGALLQTDRAYEVAETIELTVGPLGRLPLLQVTGQVLESHAKPDSTDWLVRVRFLDDETKAKPALDKYVLELLRASSLAP